MDLIGAKAPSGLDLIGAKAPSGLDLNEGLMDDEKKRNADYSHYRQALTGRYRDCTASEAMVKFDNEIRDTTSDLYLAILFFAARSPSGVPVPEPPLDT